MADSVLDHLNILVYMAVFGPMVAAVLGWLIGRKNKLWRDCFVFVVCGLELAAFLFLFVLALYGVGGVETALPGICGMGLYFRLDGFRVLYGTVAAFMWFMTTVFSKEYFGHYHNRNRYYFFLLVTLGATAGVFLSQDFFTTFVFFELMSFTSFVWVAHDEREESMRAANTYLAVAVLGGLVMLMGLFLFYAGYGDNYYVAGICMLVGFGAKAGSFPLHIWLPKAHPVAPAPASALLSGVLTKAGIFGILLLTASVFAGDLAWGTLLLTLGVITMVTGAVLALFSVDLKRTLACSSVSQIGFVLVGVGMAGLLGAGNALAVRGSILHMVNHSLIKLVLFMAAGVVFMNLHKLNLNDIRGFGRKKPLLNYIFLMGALGIGGMPLWNGYVSKTLIHESIVEFTELVAEGELIWGGSVGILRGIEWAFLISGGLTVAYMLKLYIVLFIEKNQDAKIQKQFDKLQGKYMNKASAAALTVSATLLPVLGVVPDAFMGRLADMGQSMFVIWENPQVQWFSLENLRGAGISIGIGALVYLLVVRTWLMKRVNGEKLYVNRWKSWLDLENLVYRPVILKMLPFVFGLLCRVLDSGVDGIIVFLRKTIYRDSKLPGELEEGNMLTHAAGCMVNGLQRLGNGSIWRKRPRQVDYEHKFAMLYEEWWEDSWIIARSLSFGLLLFCVGLLITVIYLLVAA